MRMTISPFPTTSTRNSMCILETDVLLRNVFQALQTRDIRIQWQTTYRWILIVWLIRGCYGVNKVPIGDVARCIMEVHFRRTLCI